MTTPNCLKLLSGDGDLPSDQVEEDCLKGDLRSLLGQLPHLQEQVLRMRYGMDGEDPMSLTGIGRILGMSRDRVRNLERDGLAGLAQGQRSGGGLRGLLRPL